MTDSNPYIDSTRNMECWGRCRDVFFDEDGFSETILKEKLVHLSETVDVIPGGEDPKHFWYQRQMFRSWMDMRLEDDFSLLIEGYFDTYDGWVNFFEELFKENEQFRNNIKEKYKAPVDGEYDGASWNDAMSLKHGKVEDDEEQTEMRDYGKLNEIGVIDTLDGKTIHEDKLRGTILAFSKSVDEIKDKRKEPDVIGINQAYKRWMLDKMGDDWTHFILDFNDKISLVEHVEYMWENNDKFKKLVQEKWTHDPRQLEGNGSKESQGEANGPQNMDGWVQKVGKTDSLQTDTNEEDGNEEDDGEEPIPVDGSDVIHGDSTSIVPRLEDNSIHALVTDPPYGQDYDSRGEGHDVIEGDDDLNKALGMTETVLKKSRMCLKKGSPIVVFCGKTNLAGVIDMVKRWYTFLDINVWDKGYVGTSQIGGTPIKWRPKHEYAVLGVYGKPRHENENRHDGNVWDFQRLSGQNMNHPTEKPVELLEYIIDSLTVEGEYILDPFAGSGSTLLAARRIGREYIGIEFDEKYYNHIVNDRLSQNTIEAY